MAEDSIELTIDDREFVRALRDIIEMSSREMPDVVDGVAKDLCFKASAKTKNARVSDIKRHARGKMFHALATMNGYPKGEGNQAKAERILNARLAARGYSKAIWLKMAGDLGSKLRKAVKSIKHAEGIRASVGVNPTAILAVEGLDVDHVQQVMQTALDSAVRTVKENMKKRVSQKLAQIAAKKSGRRR